MAAVNILSDLHHLFKSSVSAVLPKFLIKKTIKYSPISDELFISGEKLNIKNKNVYVVGTGKAVKNMAKEIEQILGPRIKEGILSIPNGSVNYKSTVKNVIYYEGAKNNLPDDTALATAKIVNKLIKNLGSDDLLLVLISGGGSALLPLPKAPLTLSEKTSLIKKLANSGADIVELNKVRKQISGLKGGQLAIKAQPAQVISLILSDIVGDPLDLIASGPTSENFDTPDAAFEVIIKYNLENELPESLKHVLKNSHPNSPFPRDNVKNYIIGSNFISTAAVFNESIKLNYNPIKLSNTVRGNVKDVAFDYVKLTKHFCEFIEGVTDKSELKAELSQLEYLDKEIDIDIDFEKDICLILGGETTVNVQGTGKGGRNQQLALEYSFNLHNIKDSLINFDIYFLSAGTDGIDGPTEAAGAIGYLNLVSESILEKIEVLNYIHNNDSYNFYKQFKNGQLHIISGHTGTNVMDIHIIIISKKR